MAPIPLPATNKNPTSNQISSQEALSSCLRGLASDFLQPSIALHSTSISAAKSYLDHLAADISHIQQQRQTLLRRKRKRGQRHALPLDKPLTLTQLYTEGFDVDQVWGQARRILEATAAELQHCLPNLQQNGIHTEHEESKSNRLSGDSQAVRFQEARDDASSDGEHGFMLHPSDDEEDGVIINGISEQGKDADEYGGNGLEREEASGGEDGDNIEESEDQDLARNSDSDHAKDEIYVRDKLGLNDGFFSIDDFNKQSEFLEQRDDRGEDDGAASDEEDIDWGVNPLAAGSIYSIGKTAEGDSPGSADDDDGPTFGNADLSIGSDVDMDDNIELEGGFDDISAMQNTNDVFYADFFAPPPRKLTKSARRRALPKTQPPSSNLPAIQPTDEDMQRAMADVRRDIFEDDLEPDELSDVSGAGVQPRSTHQKRQAELTTEIRRLESEAVAKKPWTLSGEARAGDRPLNSLLEEDLEFERTGKPVPVITQEVSEDIEALIKRRIINREFDEVIRRRPGTLTTTNGKDVKRGQVDLEDGKPIQSLAEMYEADHLRQVDPEGYVDKRSAALKKEHEKIETLWKDVNAKLDALTSLHFKPKPVEASVKVLSDVPTIMMEDARPNAGVDVGESMLAPQEVYRAGEDRNKQVEVSTRSGLPVAREEMTRQEKLRRRRREKERIRKAGGTVPNNAKDVDTGGKKAKEKSKVVGDLKKGGVKIIGKKGEVRNVEGREIKSNGVFGKGAAGYKL